MKVLKLKDGTLIQITNSSTINNLIVVAPSFNDIENYRQALTEENLSDCWIDEVHYTNVILDSVSAFAKSYENVQCSFFTKTTADAEVEALRQQVAELQQENANLTDKAEAADILMGNEEV